MTSETNYISGRPDRQKILDLFKGEWSSRLPEETGLVTEPGFAALFEDVRISWAEEQFGGFTGKSVLELGPLEGGHSYMLQKGGAESVTAIEANSRAFLKCLCVKEVLGLDKVNFLPGDFNDFLDATDARYDMVIASGVLYHMTEPVKLIERLSKVTDNLFLWTHYYDKENMSEVESVARQFGEAELLEYDGETYETSLHDYSTKDLGWDGFCGGPRPTSLWLTKESIIKALRRYGFSKIETAFEDGSRENNPSFAVCAFK